MVSEVILYDLIETGGTVMIPLFVLSFLSVIIIADRIVVIAVYKISKSDNKPDPLRYIRLLELIAQISPVLGFLGTVTGMMNSFKGISLSDNVTINAVSGGMYEALYTTAFGLIISITDSVTAQLFRWSVEKDDKESCKV